MSEDQINTKPRKARPTRRPDRPPQKRPLRRIPGLWTRLAALALVVVALIVGMVGLTLKAVRPYREASAEAAHLAQTRRLVAALTARNDTLRRHIAYLKTPEGVAEEAHRLGYMRPGERPLVILGFATAGAEDDSALGDAAPADTPPGKAPLLDRFVSHLRDL